MSPCPTCPDATRCIDAILSQLKDMAAQHECGCCHPSCNRCKDDEDNQKAIAIGDAFLEENDQAMRSHEKSPTTNEK